MDTAALASFGGAFHGEIVPPGSANYETGPAGVERDDRPATRAHRANDMVGSGDDVVRSIYGDAKYRRLVDLKRTYDPDNVFRMNQNVKP